MADYTEILNLNSTAVRDLSDAYAGYAQYLSGSEQKGMDSYTASSYLIAGTLYSLFNPQKARNAFFESANFYWRDRNPFYKIVAICGMNSDLLSVDDRKENEANGSRPEYEFGNLLAENFLRSQEQGNNYRFTVNEEIMFQPAGRLGLPIGLYTMAYRELSAIASSRPEQFQTFPAWSALLNRAAERTRMLQKDSYHWKSLKGNFLAVEPEIVAASMSFSVVTKGAGLSQPQLSDRLQVEDVALLPLLIAGELRFHLDQNDEREYRSF